MTTVPQLVARGVIETGFILTSFFLVSDLPAAEAGPGSTAEQRVICDHRIASSVTIADARGNYSMVEPGDIVCIEAGRRGRLALRNFNEGLDSAPDKPITFINDGGQVVIKSSAGNAGIEIENSRYLRLTGTGSEELEYGIKVLSPTDRSAMFTGVNLIHKSSYFEVDHLEVTTDLVATGGLRSAGIAISSKTNATCPNGSPDSWLGYDYNNDGVINSLDAVNRENFIQKDSKFHDMYIHDISMGFYVGSSHYVEGSMLDCDRTIQDPLLDGVEIYASTVENVGVKGIQVGSAVAHCDLHHNRVIRDSLDRLSGHLGGFMINPGSVCDLYSNLIKDGNGPGVYLQGGSGSRIYNNLILRAGRFEDAYASSGSGIVVASKDPPLDEVGVFNNTIIGPRTNGVVFTLTGGSGHRVQNNIIVDPGSGGQSYIVIRHPDQTEVTVSNNLTVPDELELHFTAPAQDDYSLQAPSPAIDGGLDLRSLGIVDDYLGNSRPQGAAFDIGAFEHVEAGIFQDVPSDHPYRREIEALYHAGYTAGCGTDPLRYCPDQAMTRAESAVFVERGAHGVDVAPPEPASSIFADVDPGTWGLKWATALWNDGFTTGCEIDPLRFCPDRGHTRAEGAVFYLRMLHGADYTPPEPAGLFADVPAGAWYEDWIEAGYQAGILPACNQSPLRACPDDPLTRGLAASMMVQALGLAP